MQDIIRIGARLRAARKAAGFKTAKSFLKKHKFPASTFSQHESGARIPDDKMLAFYSNVFKVNFAWLKNGKGHPYKKISAHQIGVMNEELADLKQLNPNKLSINIELLKKILKNVIKKANVKIKTDTLQFITNTTCEMYSEYLSNKIRI